MGQNLSCSARHENGLLKAIQFGELETVICMLEKEPSLLHQTSPYNRESPLHIAAAHGQTEILSLLLERYGNPDVLNRHKQTPLMMAAMNGKISCVLKLIEVGANILMFDSVRGRTCLHYAAYYGHSDCLQAILSAAQFSPIAVSWGYARFVNIRDGKGATPLHLAARQKKPECLHILLDNAALVCASTSGYGFPGSTPLHLAARGGSLDCIRELLAWGADRLQMDAAGRIPYVVALKHRHGRCAALLNPSSAEPLVWPSPLKLISELDQEAKALLEQALMKANREREKCIILKKSAYNSLPFSTQSDGGTDDHDGVSEAGDDAGLCSICFEQVCTIEVQDCGHQMCAQCTLALCCHNKPNPTTAALMPPLCPFCRSGIARLVVAKTKPTELESRDLCNSNVKKSKKSRNSSEGSSSFKGLVGIGSFRRMGGGGRSSGRIAAEEDWADKLLQCEI